MAPSRESLIEWLLQDGAARDHRKCELVGLIVEDSDEICREQDEQVMDRLHRNLAAAYHPHNQPRGDAEE